jgi:uncharacterized protein YukJ
MRFDTQSQFSHLRRFIMALTKYGVFKGTVTGHLRDADDDHYQILVKAGQSLHRIASNVKSSAPNSPSVVLFYSRTSLPPTMTEALKKLQAGFTKLASKPDSLALDYVKGNLVNIKNMKPVPADQAGLDNDLKDLIEAATVRAMLEEGSVVYAFGQKWGPETNKKDKYFKFEPGNGIHDIHMNQGNDGKYKKDNGAFQDGAIIFSYPSDKWRAFFFAFQSQSFDTDAQGNARTDNQEVKPPRRNRASNTNTNTNTKTKTKTKKARK